VLWSFFVEHFCERAERAHKNATVLKTRAVQRKGQKKGSDRPFFNTDETNIRERKFLI
jgi:hypothetical protein